MTVLKKLQLAIIAIFILIASYGYYSVTTMKDLSVAAENIFRHPLVVSNAVRDLNISILKIGVLTGQIKRLHSDEKIFDKVGKVRKIQLDMAKKYVVIEQRYLGPIQDVENSKKIFDNLVLETDLIINLLLLNRVKNTNFKDAHDHINALEKGIFDFKKTNSVISEYASGKALQLRLGATNEKIIFNAIVLLLIILVLSFIIFLTLTRSNREVSEQINMIDQNIMTASIDNKGKIKSITSQLARNFSLVKKNIIGLAINEIITDEQLVSELLYDASFGQAANGRFSTEIKNEVFWFDVLIQPHLESSGSIKKMTVVFTDVSSEKKIEEASIKDSLTGLFNRNYFELVFEKEVKKAVRDKKQMGLLMLDVDFFKQFNDVYGHFQGDGALKSVAGVILKNTQRSYDIAFRVGGEEFFIIFLIDDGSGLEEAVSFAEKIRKGIENLHISHESSDVSEQLTASIGCVVLAPEHGLSPNEIYSRVDGNLYSAKNNGRNMVVAELVS